MAKQVVLVYIRLIGLEMDTQMNNSRVGNSAMI